MHLIQILLPLNDNSGAPFSFSQYDRVFHELAERFGGVTAYQRAPAQGAWKDEGRISYDQVVIFEVMTDRLDRDHWAAYRLDLEQRFQQEEILIRASQVERL